jgi:hypothetical protein
VTIVTEARPMLRNNPQWPPHMDGGGDSRACTHYPAGHQRFDYALVFKPPGPFSRFWFRIPSYPD